MYIRRKKKETRRQKLISATKNAIYITRLHDAGVVMIGCLAAFGVASLGRTAADKAAERKEKAEAAKAAS